jgi:hypothetical protein
MTKCYACNCDIEEVNDKGPVNSCEPCKEKSMRAGAKLFCGIVWAGMAVYGFFWFRSAFPHFLR